MTILTVLTESKLQSHKGTCSERKKQDYWQRTYVVVVIIIIQTEMKGRSEEEAGTERVLKSRYGQKDRHRATGQTEGHSKKVMLVDLCPEEKLKVGQLIKINEVRRVQIEELQQESSLLKSALADSQSQFIEVERETKQNQEETRYLKEQLLKLKEITLLKQNQIDKLEAENRLFLNQAKKKENIAFLSIGIQTAEVSSSTAAVQTKKLKTKERLIQTDDVEEHQEHNIQRERRAIQKNSHSKSFQNVRPRWTPLDKRNISHRDSLNSHSHSPPVEFQGDECLEQDMDECFSDLTHKWLQLKEKNLSKLKAQYSESKQKLYQENELGTFGPRQLVLQPEDTTEKEENNDIDDIELNKMLKSNNFSASRLLNSKGNLASSQNSRKQSYHIESNNTEQTKGDRIRREPLQAKDYHLNIAAKKGRERTEGKASYFDGDLMDLVDSLE